ncbi:carbohydrate esterase family 5 protein [Biscogniauxia marginata]|nr:carbohydrate esterase family 5 protein [Biscogniauxia marginata]
MYFSSSPQTSHAGRRRRRAVLSAVLPVLASAQSTGAGTCTDVHTFLARGNNEPYPGRQGKLVDAICEGLGSGCDYEDIVFDNALETEYCSAVEAGRVAGRKQIAAYNDRCPDTKLVVSGYSQGAQVVGDILGGGGGTFFQGCTINSSDGLDPVPGSKIAAALLFGDTRHTGGQSYNVLGGAPDNGLFPRSGDQLAGLNKFSGVLRSYCQAEDPICARGNTVADHLNYFDVFSDAAGEWVKSVVDVTPSSTVTSSTASQTSGSASPSTSESGSSTSGEASSTTEGTSSVTGEPSSTATDTAVSSTSEGSSSPTAAPTGDNQSGGAEAFRCGMGLVSLVILSSLLFSVLQ